MHKNIKWSAIVLGASLAMTAAMPAIPAMAASHHGEDHGGRHWQHGHGHHGQQGQHDQHSRHNHGDHHGQQNQHGHDRDHQGKDHRHHGHGVQDRLKVTQRAGVVTTSEAAVLSGMTLSQGTAASVFAKGTPFTVYTVRLVGRHALWSGIGAITVSDNNGSLSTPADLYYLGFQRGFMHPDPFQGDTAPYNADTVGQSSSFSVQFVRGQAQFAVFDGKAGSGPIQITVQDHALKQSQTVTYLDTVGTTTAPATASGVTVVGSGTVSLAPGQSTTVQFQVTNQYGQPLAQPGDTVDLALAGVAGGTVPAGVTLDSAVPTASTPLALQTDSNGTVSATLTDISDTAATYAVDAVLASSPTATPAHIMVTDVSAQGAVAALALSSAAVTSGPVAPLAIPATITVPVGTTLTPAELGAGVNAPVYVEGLNTSGDVANGLGTAGDTLMAQTSNGSVVSVSGWNALGETTLSSGVTSLPVITAEATGIATVTLADVTNPAASPIVLTIDVVAAQPIMSPR